MLTLVAHINEKIIYKRGGGCTVLFFPFAHVFLKLLLGTVIYGQSRQTWGQGDKIVNRLGT